MPDRQQHYREMRDFAVRRGRRAAVGQGRVDPEDTDPAAALAKGRLHFRLDGEKLRGSWILTRTSRGDERAAWLLIKRHDEEARPGIDITLEQPESVKRAPKAARRASRAALPQFVTPQLATLVTRPPKTGDWVYEVKHDERLSNARQIF